MSNFFELEGQLTKIDVGDMEQPCFLCGIRDLQGKYIDCKISKEIEAIMLNSLGAFMRVSGSITTTEGKKEKEYIIEKAFVLSNNLHFSNINIFRQKQSVFF